MTFDSKEYRARPEIKARSKEYHKEYRARPEIKARMKAQSKEYHARPEIKARMKAQSKEYYAMLRERQKFLLDNPDEIEKLRVKMMRDLERGFI